MCVIDPHKLVITQPFFNIFALNFQNRFRNRDCRTIFDLKKRENVENHLKCLHWLGGGGISRFDLGSFDFELAVCIPEGLVYCVCPCICSIQRSKLPEVQKC